MNFLTIGSVKIRKMIIWTACFVSAGIMFVASKGAIDRIFEFDKITNHTKNFHIEKTGVIEKDGYNHVFAEINQKKYFVTKGNFNHNAPIASKEFIVWVKDVAGSNQIELHDTLKDTTLQLTHTSNNQNPSINGKNVAWERWTGSTWQIFYFDGKEIRQISKGKVAYAPRFDGDSINYKADNGNGKSINMKYDTKTRKTKKLD